MGNLLRKVFYSENTTPLPVAVVSVLFIILLFNAMTMTMVFSYLPQLVKNFGYSEVDTGYYAGLIATSLFIGRTCFSLAWGGVADAKGKKKTLLITAVGLTCATILFGFSFNVLWAFLTRLLQGCFQGIIIVAKAIVVDVCDDTNIALGMTIVISSFSTGLIIGPSIGGFLVFPSEQFPNVFSEDSLFGRFVILLPNLVIVIGFAVGIILVFFFIPNDRKKRKIGEEAYLITNEENNVPKTYGLTESKKHDDNESYFNFSIEQSTNAETNRIEEDKINNSCYVSHFQLIEPISKSSPTVSTGCCGVSFTKEGLKNSTFVKLLRSKECMLTSLLYGTYSISVIGYDELFPLYTATSKEYGGLGFSPSDIGLVLLVVSAILIVIQILVISRLTAKYGPIKTFIVSCVVMVVFMPLTPLAGLITNKTYMWVFVVIHLAIIRFPMAVGFVTINIMLNNSAISSQRSSANGMGMTVSSLGRAIAPATFGSLYSWSLTQRKNTPGNTNPIGFPFNQYFTFFVMSFVLILNALIASKLPESLAKKKVETTAAEETTPETTPETRTLHLTMKNYFPEV